MNNNIKIISHRGNLSGPDHKNENKPEAVEYAISLGFDVEIDLRYHNKKFYLGHDEPQYEIEFGWLLSNQYKLWIHCKDIATIYRLLSDDWVTNKLNYFFHDQDDVSVTSHKFIWTYPSNYLQLTKKSIAIALNPSWNKDDYKSVAGVCSDYVLGK